MYSASTDCFKYINRQSSIQFLSGNEYYCMWLQAEQNSQLPQKWSTSRISQVGPQHLSRWSLLLSISVYPKFCLPSTNNITVSPKSFGYYPLRQVNCFLILQHSKKVLHQIGVAIDLQPQKYMILDQENSTSFFNCEDLSLMKIYFKIN